MNKKIADDLIYVGVNDLEIDLFEGQYKVPTGMTYNSYMIIDEKIAIFDTVDKKKQNDYIKNIEETLSKDANGRNPDYIIISHLEADHAGSIEELLNKYPNMKVVVNQVSNNMFNQFFDIDITDRTIIVKEGENLNLGKHNLKFIMAPMVHWPEVMFTYDEYTKTLFSADGFGKFGAFLNDRNIILDITENDTCNWKDTWDDEARRYYINICGKYGMQVQAVLNKLADTEINTICPLHGPILTGNLSHYLDKYNTWSKYEPEEDGVLIVYATIHGNTEEIANKLYNELKNQGKKVEIRDIARSYISEVISLAYKYSKIVIASVTYNMSIFPDMNLFLTLLKEKNFQNRKIAIIENGSWAPNAANIIKSFTAEMKGIEIIEPVITVKSKLKDDEEIKKLCENL